MQNLARFVNHDWVVAQLHIMPGLRFCGVRNVLRYAYPLRDFWVVRNANFPCLIVGVQNDDIFCRVNGFDGGCIEIEKRLFASDVLSEVAADMNQFPQPFDLLLITGSVNDENIVILAVFPGQIVEHRFYPADAVNVSEVKHILVFYFLFAIQHNDPSRGLL